MSRSHTTRVLSHEQIPHHQRRHASGVKVRNSRGKGASGLLGAQPHLWPPAQAHPAQSTLNDHSTMHC
eukprot:187647-Chlamydomonas_euryale.AAC.1